MKNGLTIAINILGSQSQLAKLLGVSRFRVNKWLNNEEDIPLHQAIRIENLTCGVVTADQLTVKDPTTRKALRSIVDRGKQNIVSVTIRTLIHHNPDIANLDQSFSMRELQDIPIKPIIIDSQYHVISGIQQIQKAIYLKGREIPAKMLNLELLLSGKTTIANDTNLLISERVAVGITLERFIGNRQGQRTDIAHKHGFTRHLSFPRKNIELRDNCPEVDFKKRTSKHAAKILAFGSRKTYERAKKVITDGSKNLILAIDQNLISISKAAQIAQLLIEEQETYLETTYTKEGKALCRQ